MEEAVATREQLLKELVMVKNDYAENNKESKSIE